MFKAKAGLPRTAGDNHQIGVLETGGQPVQPGEPRGDAGNGLLAVEEQFQGANTFGNDVPEGIDQGIDFIFGDLENGLLGLVQQVLGIAAVVESLAGDFRGPLDQAAQDRLLPDDAGIGVHMNGGGNGIGQGGQVGDAAHILQLPFFLQGLGQGDQIHRRPFLVEIEHGGKDLAVGLPIKIVSGHHFQNPGKGLRVQ